MNLAKIAERLQTALCRKGRRIRVNRSQYYTDEGRLRIMYQVCETIDDADTGKKRTEVYCKSARMVDVVTVLRALYEGGE